VSSVSHAGGRRRRRLRCILVSGTVAVKSVSGNEMWKYCERGCNYGERTTSIEIIGMGNVSAVLSGKDFIGLYHDQDLLTLIKNSIKLDFVF
jgi:hypothetical protein